MSYFDNLRVIAQGGGSDQARACRDKKCPQCDDDDLGKDEEKPSSLEEQVKRVLKDLAFMHPTVITESIIDNAFSMIHIIYLAGLKSVLPDVIKLLEEEIAQKEKLK